MLPSGVTAGEPLSAGDEEWPPLMYTTSPAALPSDAATETPAMGVFVQGDTLLMSTRDHRTQSVVAQTSRA